MLLSLIRMLILTMIIMRKLVMMMTMWSSWNQPGCRMGTGSVPCTRRTLHSVSVSHRRSLCRRDQSSTSTRPFPLPRRKHSQRTAEDSSIDANRSRQDPKYVKTTSITSNVHARRLVFMRTNIHTDYILILSIICKEEELSWRTVWCLPASGG